MIDLKALQAPFPASEIQWRIGSTSSRDGKIFGLALAYYDARALYDRLDAVCGPENWQIRYPHANGKTCAEIGIRINNEWVWKANGAGDSQMEAEKGAFSDAAKRAGVPWGIGRYLYEMTDTWVECEERGKSKVIKKSEYTKLNAAYERFVKNGEKPSMKLLEDTPMDEVKLITDAIDEAGSPEELQSVKDTKITPAWKRLPQPNRDKITDAYTKRLANVSQAPMQ